MTWLRWTPIGFATIGVHLLGVLGTARLHGDRLLLRPTTAVTAAAMAAAAYS